MAKESIPWGTIILLGALGVAGYFLYNWLKNSDIAKAVETVTNTISTTTETIKQVPVYLTTPVLPPLEKGLGIYTPSPIQLIEPVSLVPNIIKTAITDPKGNINPLGASIKATALVGLVTGAIKPKTTALKAQPKAQIPIVTVTPSTKGVSILKPLEIVKTGKLIHDAGTALKKPGILVNGVPQKLTSVTVSQPISPTKVATVTKAPSIPTKVTISKIIRS